MCCWLACVGVCVGVRACVCAIGVFNLITQPCQVVQASVCTRIESVLNVSATHNTTCSIHTQSTVRSCRRFKTHPAHQNPPTLSPHMRTQNLNGVIHELYSCVCVSKHTHTFSFHSHTYTREHTGATRCHLVCSALHCTAPHHSHPSHAQFTSIPPLHRIVVCNVWTGLCAKEHCSAAPCNGQGALNVSARFVCNDQMRFWGRTRWPLGRTKTTRTWAAQFSEMSVKPEWRRQRLFRL